MLLFYVLFLMHQGCMLLVWKLIAIQGMLNWIIRVQSLMICWNIVRNSDRVTLFCPTPRKRYLFLFLRYFCVSSNNLSTRFCDVHEAMQITFNWFNQVLFMHYHDHNLNYVAWNQKYVLYMSLSDTLGNTNLKWLKHFNLRIIFNG